MKLLLSAEEMYACDRYTIEKGGVSSRVLMERAARAAARCYLDAGFPREQIRILTLGGNNGGDGFAMARFLLQKGCRVSVGYLGRLSADGRPDASGMTVECARQYERWCVIGGETKTPFGRGPEGLLYGANAVIDAMLGIGLRSEVRGAVGDMIAAVNASGLPVFSVDIPSGIDADRGVVCGCAIRADVTATMAYMKRGLLLSDGAVHAGRVEVCDIGVTLDGIFGEADFCALSEEDLPGLLPPRFMRSNKGTYGRVLIVAGSYAMCGAALLAARAAYRAGAGLVTVCTPECNRVIVQTALPEAVLLPYDPENLDEGAVLDAVARADAIVIGCGLSQSAAAKRLLSLVLQTSRVPTVVDADALNLLSGDPGIRTGSVAPLILTPHMGEMARLTREEIPTLLADPVGAARRVAEAFSGICVLKDARSVTTDGRRVFVNSSGNHGMSTGGSGDVLAGVLGGLLAGMREAGEYDRLALTSAGVYLHGLAGDAARRSYGARSMMASDLLSGLSAVLATLDGDVAVQK